WRRQFKNLCRVDCRSSREAGRDIAEKSGTCCCEVRSCFICNFCSFGRKAPHERRGIFARASVVTAVAERGPATTLPAIVILLSKRRGLLFHLRCHEDRGARLQTCRAQVERRSAPGTWLARKHFALSRARDRGSNQGRAQPRRPDFDRDRRGKYLAWGLRGRPRHGWKGGGIHGDAGGRG